MTPNCTSHPPRLAEQLGDPPLHLGHVPADAERPRPVVQDPEDGLDLLVVVHRGGVQDASIDRVTLPISGTSCAEWPFDRGIRA